MDQVRLKELLNYDMATGLFTWKKRVSRAKIRGNRAGYVTVRGYVHLGADRKVYKAHRLAWLYVTGAFPAGELDHIDGDRANNRFSNLRIVTRGVNLQNRHKPGRTNRSGFLGVQVKGSRWRAAIKANGVQYRLGYFNSPEGAAAAYQSAKRRLHPEAFSQAVDLFGQTVL
jgi:hypothetical protein